jgi:hypothetical protein
MPENSAPNSELVKSAGEEKTVVEIYDSKHGTYKPAEKNPTDTNPATKLDPKPF